RAVASADELRTDLYRNEHRQLVEQLVGIELREKHARQGLERTLDLVELGLAPRTDAEDAEFALAGLEAERSSLIQARVGTWHTRRDQLQEELVRLRERRTLLEEDRARSVVRAPISGTLEQMVNVSAGSFVQAGERLATVSPSAELVAEVFVSPADFGLLEVGAPVRLLIDAFNYSDWGFIPGQVLELPDDVLMLE